MSLFYVIIIFPMDFKKSCAIKIQLDSFAVKMLQD